MAAMTDYLENELLDHVFGNGAYTQPANWMALFTADPTDAGTQTNEVTGGSYARVDVSTFFGLASGGSITNDTQVSFADMPATTVTHAAIIDASTAGNMLVHGALSASRTTNAGDTFIFEVGNYTVTAD